MEQKREYHILLRLPVGVLAIATGATHCLTPGRTLVRGLRSMSSNAWARLWGGLFAEPVEATSGVGAAEVQRVILARHRLPGVLEV